MSADLQKRFKEMAKDETVFVGGKFATQNDLCALFTMRAAALYLRSNGRIAFVLPMAALSRGQFEGLRSGRFKSVNIAWDEAWAMDDSVQPLFPVPSCVVFGRRRALANGFPKTVRAYSGALPYRDAPEDVADAQLGVVEGAPALQVGVFAGGSVYRKAFRQGATLVPRMLCLVERQHGGRLGVDASAPPVISRRNPQEKRPWKDLPAIQSRVEAEFLRPVLLGESILPYRVFRSFEGVIPVSDKGEMLDSEAAANRGYDGLPSWMRRAEGVWNANADSGGMTLADRWNYHNELTSQFPVLPLRVVYAASGTNPAACIIRTSEAVVEHKLYWGAIESEMEAQFLIAILNSEAARVRTEGLQSRGQFGARDFDKVIFSLPIPRFDPAVSLHGELAEAAAQAEALAASVEIPENMKFQRARALVRGSLVEAGIAGRIDQLVARLLDSP
jgi:hypothetical protein